MLIKKHGANMAAVILKIARLRFGFYKTASIWYSEQQHSCFRDIEIERN